MSELGGGGGGGAGSGGGFLRSLQEQKLKSFSIGTMGKKALSKKEQDDLRKKQEQDEVGKVYEEFVSTFEDNNTSKVSKTWIKAGTFNAGNRKEDSTGKGTLYKPTARFDLDRKEKGSAAKPERESPASAKRPEKPGKKKEKEKKKSNLELFKEELKAMQEERQERHRYKGMLKSGAGGKGDLASAGGGKDGSASAYQDLPGQGSHDVGDPNTTNLYLGNLSPRLTEQSMMELFGRYGPLASIKIMWPRTEDEKARGRNCGFVAYMARADGERALDALSGRTIDGFEMKMGWGKPVPIPLHPIYVPPKLLKASLPPPPSGLPFNTQPRSEEERMKWGSPSGGKVIIPADAGEKRKFEKMLFHATVQVVMPTDRTTLCLINRMVEFVVREGPMFEAMVMNKELNNPTFRFLFENQSPEHIYYRWRLFSLLQGDTKEHWHQGTFRMFKGGSLWRPPRMNLYTAGMPEEFVEPEGDEKKSDSKKSDRQRGDRDRDRDRDRDTDRRKAKKDSGLSDSQRDRFEDMLRNLYPDRNPIAEAMIWCLEHAAAGEEIVECISEALSIMETPMSKKIARLYLISDILHNCSVKGVHNVSYYHKGFQAKLPDIFGDLFAYHKAIEARMRAEAFKQRVLSCFRAWEDWALYPQDYLIRLQNIFLGLVSAGEGNNLPLKDDDYEDVDGKSMSEDDDVDGIPLDGAALLKTAAQKGTSAVVTPSSRHSSSKRTSRRRSESGSDSDVDGTPLPSLAGPAADSKSAPGFVPSKWETVDPEIVQAQAVTTSKWEKLEGQPDSLSRKRGITEPDDEDDVDGVPMDDDDAIGKSFNLRVSEDRRAKLREIELKVMCYQDELEAGQIPSKSGWTISEQVEAFRKKLLKQSVTGGNNTPSSTTSAATPTHRSQSRNDNDDDETEGEDSVTPSRGSRSSKKSKKKSKHRSRNRSSSSKSRSRSRSRERDRKRRRRRSSSQDEQDDRDRNNRNKRRSRSRSPTSRKHKKKNRH